MTFDLPLWMSDFIQNYGFWALMLSSFIAATLFPASSSALMFAAMAAGMSPLKAFISASVGNSTGCAVNYWLGYLIGKPLIPRLQRSHSGRKAIGYTQKYGTWSLFISWTPFLGDPITIAAGIFRISFVKFVAIAISLRVLGYLILTLFFI